MFINNVCSYTENKQMYTVYNNEIKKKEMTMQLVLIITKNILASK